MHLGLHLETRLILFEGINGILEKYLLFNLNLLYKKPSIIIFYRFLASQKHEL
jgi:hypothetical protein